MLPYKLEGKVIGEGTYGLAYRGNNTSTRKTVGKRKRSGEEEEESSTDNSNTISSSTNNGNTTYRIQELHQHQRDVLRDLQAEQTRKQKGVSTIFTAEFAATNLAAADGANAPLHATLKFFIGTEHTFSAQESLIVQAFSTTDPSLMSSPSPARVTRAVDHWADKILDPASDEQWGQTLTVEIRRSDWEVQELASCDMCTVTFPEGSVPLQRQLKGLESFLYVEVPPEASKDSRRLRSILLGTVDSSLNNRTAKFVEGVNLQKYLDNNPLNLTLNQDQEDVARFIFSHYATVFQGPGGTGKTELLLFSLFVLLDLFGAQPTQAEPTQHKRKVLFCSPTNANALSFAQQVKKRLSGVSVVLVCARAREADEHDAIALHVRVDRVLDGTDTIPGTELDLNEARLLHSLKVSGESYKDSEYKKLRLELECAILNQADVICTTCNAASDDRLLSFSSERNFKALLLDEVTLEHLGGVAPALQYNTVEWLISCGDPAQMQVFSDKNTNITVPLKRSFFSYMEEAIGLEPEQLMLTTQHRMGHDLCNPVSKGSYKGKLTTQPERRELLESKPFQQALAAMWDAGCVKAARRFIFDSSTIKGTDPPKAVYNHSAYSLQDAQLVVEVALLFLSFGFSGSQILVVSPYLAQVRLVEALLRRSGHSGALDIALKTTRTAQGSEYPIVITTAVKQKITSFVDQRQWTVMNSRSSGMEIVVNQFLAPSFYPDTSYLGILMRSVIDNNAVLDLRRWEDLQVVAQPKHSLGMNPCIAHLMESAGLTQEAVRAALDRDTDHMRQNMDLEDTLSKLQKLLPQPPEKFPNENEPDNGPAVESEVEPEPSAMDVAAEVIPPLWDETVDYEPEGEPEVESEAKSAMEVTTAAEDAEAAKKRQDAEAAEKKRLRKVKKLACKLKKKPLPQPQQNNQPAAEQNNQPAAEQNSSGGKRTVFDVPLNTTTVSALLNCGLPLSTEEIYKVEQLVTQTELRLRSLRTLEGKKIKANSEWFPACRPPLLTAPPLLSPAPAAPLPASSGSAPSKNQRYKSNKREKHGASIPQSDPTTACGKQHFSPEQPVHWHHVQVYIPNNIATPTLCPNLYKLLHEALKPGGDGRAMFTPHWVCQPAQPGTDASADASASAGASAGAAGTSSVQDPPAPAPAGAVEAAASGMDTAGSSGGVSDGGSAGAAASDGSGSVGSGGSAGAAAAGGGGGGCCGGGGGGGGGGGEIGDAGGGSAVALPAPDAVERMN